MVIVKRLPSRLAQYVYSYDDTFLKVYNYVIMELIHYNIYNINNIYHLNKLSTKYTLNKKGNTNTSYKRIY